MCVCMCVRFWDDDGGKEEDKKQQICDLEWHAMNKITKSG